MSVSSLYGRVSAGIGANGSQVYLVADLEAQNFKIRTNENKRKKLE